MAAWLIFIRERFSLPVHALLVGGFTMSGVLLGSHSIAWRAIVVNLIGLTIFFAVLRLMDEVKDYEKDRVAHPDRPLPRGVLEIDRAARAVPITTVLMSLWALCTVFIDNLHAGACYGVVTAYLWLMYREFYCGKWLESQPLLYALTHQLILLPLVYFSVVSASPEQLTAAQPLYLCLLLIGTFFAYEVCRKLDPEAHPVLKTYLHTHGRAGSFVIVLIAMSIAGSGAWLLRLHGFLWPFEIALLLSLTLIWLRPVSFRITETVAGLCLMAHLWAIPGRAWWSSL